jgi:hypothetical protein
MLLAVDDESWMFHSYHREAMLVLSWSDIEGIETPSHSRKKIMITVFLNGTRESPIDLRSEGKKMDSMFSTQHLIDPLAAHDHQRSRRFVRKHCIGCFQRTTILTRAGGPAPRGSSRTGRGGAGA